MSRARDGVATGSGRFERYAPDLHRYLMRFIERAQDAEDIRQEVFARLSRLRDRELARDPKAYLFGIAFHVMHEFRMRQRRERVTFDSEAAHHALERPRELRPDELAEQLNLRQQLERALEQLPPHERAALLLIKRDGMSYKEAARASGLSVHQIERYFISARARLKTMLWER
jgi:RNA polymerase sigma-70 factor (ECF subfamily)